MISNWLQRNQGCLGSPNPILRDELAHIHTHTQAHKKGTSKQFSHHLIISPNGRWVRFQKTYQFNPTDIGCYAILSRARDMDFSISSGRRRAAANRNRRITKRKYLDRTPIKVRNTGRVFFSCSCRIIKLLREQGKLYHKKKTNGRKSGHTLFISKGHKLNCSTTFKTER